MRRDLWLRQAPADIVERWPQARQVAALRTTHLARRRGERVREEQWRYFLVVGPRRGGLHGPKRIAQLIRGHWGIENRLHHILDRTLGEDGRRSSKGAAPMALALAARSALALLGRFEVPGRKDAGIPEKRIHVAAKPERFLRLLA